MSEENKDRFKFRYYAPVMNRYLNNSEIMGFVANSIVTTIQTESEEDLNAPGREQALALDVDGGVIEQCTGLKDRNGNLIYEGDILGGSNGSINGREWPFQSTVSWDHSRAKFSMPVWAYDEEGTYREDSTHYVEIIGNIHETKTKETENA